MRDCDKKRLRDAIKFDDQMFESSFGLDGGHTPPLLVELCRIAMKLDEQVSELSKRVKELEKADE